MRRALRLASRGRGRVEPNPMVGCVLTRGSRTIGEGYHRRFGGDHAEVDAIRRSSGAPKGATAYVTLEPCSHHGKTPPCCDALIKAGVERVVVAMADPFPQVSGRGIRRLRAAGIKVDVGLLGKEAAALNRPYLVRLKLKRPYVVGKWAQSLDGKIATRSGESKWISSDTARAHVHRLRSRVDAVVVGVNTVLADNPLLTARGVAIKRTAARVVFDSHLRIPVRCRLARTIGDAPLIVFTTTSAVRAKPAHARRLESLGATIVATRALRRHVSMTAALARMATMGWTNILFEGGGSILGSCFDANVVDEAHVFTSPLIIGGRTAPTGCDGKGVATLARAHRASQVRRRMFGDTQLTLLRLDRLGQ